MTVGAPTARAPQQRRTRGGLRGHLGAVHAARVGPAVLRHHRRVRNDLDLPALARVHVVGEQPPGVRAALEVLRAAFWNQAQGIDPTRGRASDEWCSCARWSLYITARVVGCTEQAAEFPRRQVRRARVGRTLTSPPYVHPDRHRKRRQEARGNDPTYKPGIRPLQRGQWQRNLKFADSWRVAQLRTLSNLIISSDIRVEHAAAAAGTPCSVRTSPALPGGENAPSPVEDSVVDHSELIQHSGPLATPAPTAPHHSTSWRPPHAAPKSLPPRSFLSASCASSAQFVLLRARPSTRLPLLNCAPR